MREGRRCWRSLAEPAAAAAPPPQTLWIHAALNLTGVSMGGLVFTFKSESKVTLCALTVTTETEVSEPEEHKEEQCVFEL